MFHHFVLLYAAVKFHKVICTCALPTDRTVLSLHAKDARFALYKTKHGFEYPSRGLLMTPGMKPTDPEEVV